VSRAGEDIPGPIPRYKVQNGPIECVVNINVEMIGTRSFLCDRQWTPGSKRRDFFGFYDPNGIYGAVKHGKAMQEEAARREVV
jgi:hypothetical protein